MPIETINGGAYKNPAVFVDGSKEICYQTEALDVDEEVGVYRYCDFLILAKGDEGLAAKLFQTVEWQRPETVLAEGDLY